MASDGRPSAAFVTPGSFCIPSSRASSVETVIQRLAEQLSDRARIRIYGRRSTVHPRFQERGGITYIRPHAGREGKVYISRVLAAMKGKSFDVIQVDNRPRYVVAVKRRFPHTPVWLSLHSLSFVSKNRIGRGTLGTCFRLADRVIVNSEFLKERLVARFPEIGSKMVVNHLAVDPGRFTSRWTSEGAASREHWMAKHGLAGKKVILYVGRLMPMKGVHHILEAMPDILRDVPNAHLVIVGGAFYGSKRETPYVRRLKRLAHKVRRSVTFVPYVPHDRIHYWYRTADAAVVPSSGREAFGLVNVEAMAAGVPVVATAAGGIREIVVHGRTGYLVNPHQLRPELARYVSRLLKDDSLARQMGMESVRRVQEHFTWKHTADRWLNLLRENSGTGWKM